LSGRKPVMPDPKGALLCYVDANSDYGIVAVYAVSDGTKTKVLETPKLRPPNRGRRLMEAARRRRAAAQGRKPNVNYALARLSERFRREGLGEVRHRSDIQEGVQESERKERDNELRYTGSRIS